MISREIKYGTPLHTKIREAVWLRYNLSQKEMCKRHDTWKNVDELYRAYVVPTERDTYREGRRKAGKPEYTTLYIPYGYAMLLAAHTYWTSVFLSRNPVLQYTARHGEPAQKVQAIEALVDYQVQVGEMLAPLYVWLLDVGKYGIGILGNYWAEEWRNVSQIVEVQKTILGIPVPGSMKKAKATARVKGYAGNKLYNVRPHDFFPDPRVSLANFQQGEFCGRLTQAGWNSIVRNQELGEYFNLDKLKDIWNSQADRVSLSTTDNLPFGNFGYEDVLTGPGSLGPFELLEMVIELIPSEWELGSGDSPEKWMFTLAGGRSGVIVGAKPQGLLHDKFPFTIQLYEVNGYDLSPRGMLEVIKPLNEVMNWLVNSHMYNVRQAINNQFVVDPSRISMEDLRDGQPGKLIRLLPQAYGTDPKMAVAQLPVVDVTTGHIANMQLIADVMQRVTGASDNVQGMMNAGGRKTATEVRTSSSFSINRLRTNAEYFSALGWTPMAQMLLQNTQQLYDEEQTFRIAGDLLNRNQTLVVSPESIQGFYDFVPVDGTLPIDRFAQATLWKEILLGLGKMPQIATQYDVGGIFSWMAQLAGLKNITQFKLQVQPDQMIAQQMAAGNLTSMAGDAPQTPEMQGVMNAPVQ